MGSARSTRWGAGLLTCLLVLSACSADTEVEAAGSAELVPELVGQFETIGGGQIDLGSLQGQDVVLWFWAPW